MPFDRRFPPNTQRGISEKIKRNTSPELPGGLGTFAHWLFMKEGQAGWKGRFFFKPNRPRERRFSKGNNIFAYDLSTGFRSE